MNNNLDFCRWISGFTDGEGCFSISFRFRNRNAIDIEAQPSFSIAQKISVNHYKLLSEIRDYFQTGSIRSDKSCYKYETRNLKDILKVIIPFFERYPLKSDKKKDFEIFSEICSRMKNKQHLNHYGLINILELARSLNLSGKRRYSVDTLILFLKKDAF